MKRSWRMNRMRRALSSVGVVAVLVVIVTASAIGAYAVLDLAQTTTINSSSSYHHLTFSQQGTCSDPTTYVAPWAVTLNNTITLSQPPNVTVPASVSSWERTPNNNPTIVFSVPDGTYSYVVYPLSPVFGESGIVIVNGQDVTILVQYQGIGDGCTASQTSSS
jgi:hypothetical protein